MPNDDTTKIATIRRMEHDCRRFKAVWEERHEEAKDAKARWETALAGLCKYIQESDQQELDLDG